jgi:hypothetical protein
MNIANLSYNDALTIFGTRARIARALGIKPQAVYQWGGKLPPLRAYELTDYVNVAVRSDDDMHRDVRIKAEALLARKNAA